MIDEPQFHDRLRVLCGRHFNHTVSDLHVAAASMLFGGSIASIERDIDDALVQLARYARQSIEWLEEQSMDRIGQLLQATSRLIAIENGTRDPLNPAARMEDS